MKYQTLSIHYESQTLPANGVEPFEIFKALSLLSHEHFFLEGFEEWDGESDYCLMGLDPFETLVIQNKVLKIYGGEMTAPKKIFPGDPFVALKNHLYKYKTSIPSKSEMPFRGGAVGYVGYDCARFFESSLNFKKADKASQPEACLMLFRKIIAIARDGTHVVVTSNIFKEDHDRLKGVSNEDIKKTLDSIKKSTPLSANKKSKPTVNPDDLKAKASIGREIFIKKVKILKEHIKAGDIFQCVLSDRFVARTRAAPLDIYGALRKTNPSPFMFYVSTPFETFLGASPERLVKVSQGQIEVNPIAGTRPRGKNAIEDKKLEKNLWASTKEKAEHLMLVDLGRNDVGRVASAGSVRVVEFMKLRRFSDVMHLISKVRAKLAPKKTSWDAFQSCFPAGTLSGAPKIRAMELIEEQEKEARGFYGGAVVRYEFSGDLDSCIMIRSLRYNKGEVTFQAGAGIVADSSPEREYDEILAKSRSVRRALLIAERGDLR